MRITLVVGFALALLGHPAPAQEVCEPDVRARCTFEDDAGRDVIDWLAADRPASWLKADERLELHGLKHGWGYAISSIDRVPTRAAARCPSCVLDAVADLASRKLGDTGEIWPVLSIAQMLQRNGRSDDARRILTAQLERASPEADRNASRDLVSLVEQALGDIDHESDLNESALEHYRLAQPRSGGCSLGMELARDARRRFLEDSVLAAGRWDEVERMAESALFAPDRCDPTCLRSWIDAELVLGHARDSSEVLAQALARTPSKCRPGLEAAERSWRLARLDDDALYPHLDELLRGDRSYTGRAMSILIERGPAAIEAYAWVFDSRDTFERNDDMAEVLARLGTPCIGRAIAALRATPCSGYDRLECFYDVYWSRANEQWLALTGD